MEIKVRIKETDLLGHINHANYFTYMEEARIKFFNKIGLEVTNDDCTVILAAANCDYIRQGYFNQTLVVTTNVKRIGRTSFTLVSNIVEKESNELIAKGEVTVVYFNINKQKPEELPNLYKEKLNERMVS